jgi:hypothetical protein
VEHLKADKPKAEVAGDELDPPTPTELSLSRQKGTVAGSMDAVCAG